MPGVPAAFRGASEYDRSYKWTDQEARAEASAPFAGKQSTKMVRSNEPPLQHKRRIAPYPDNKILDENTSVGPNGDAAPIQAEIFLGGKKNEKFGPSVAHVVKSKLRHPEMDAPAPVTAPAPASTELRLPREAARDTDEAQTPIRFDPTELRLPKEASRDVPDMAPRQRAQVPALRPSNEPVRRRRKAPRAPAAPERERRRVEKTRKANGRQAPRRRTVEPDPDPGRREEVLPEHYAKQRQLGLRGVQRPAKANHMTEYGRQFEWRPGEHQSPLLRAEDIIFRSHLDMPKDLRVSDTTEYRRQFKAFRYEPVPKARKAVDDGPRSGQEERVARAVDQALANRRRPSPPPPPPPRVVVDGETYGPGEALNPQRMSFPLGRQRKFLSEYNANFRDFVHTPAPSPAHLLAGGPAKPEEAKEDDASLRRLWFEEIMDLRRRAEEYKLRARGTHFSREHAAQILGAPTAAAVPAPAPGREEVSDGERTPRNESDAEEADEAQSTPRVAARTRGKLSRHHLARTTPCADGVILGPGDSPSARTASSVVVGKPRDLSRTDNLALRLAGSGEALTGLRRAPSPDGGAYLAAGRPTSDRDPLRASAGTADAWPEPARRDDVIYEGFGETYLVPGAADACDLDVEDLEEEEAAERASSTSYISNSSSRRPASSVSSVVPPRGPPAAPRDDDAASTLDSVRSIISSSSAVAEETLARARRNQERNWPVAKR